MQAENGKTCGQLGLCGAYDVVCSENLRHWQADCFSPQMAAISG